MSFPAQVVRFGPFQLDLRAAELRHDGTRIKLPEQPFQILCELAEHPGEVVTREELRRRLWHASTRSCMPGWARKRRRCGGAKRASRSATMTWLSSSAGRCSTAYAPTRAFRIWSGA